MSDILMGWPRTTPLPLPPRRVRAVRQQPTVKGMVFAEFARAVEAQPTVEGEMPRWPNENDADYIKSRIEIDAAGCWIWQLAQRGTSRMAHILSYRTFRGPVPAGLELDHLCRVRSCVNPDHLEAVTPRVNTRRSLSPAARNAVKTHCIHGHEFSLENTYLYRNMRQCRACQKARDGRRGDRHDSASPRVGPPTDNGRRGLNRNRAGPRCPGSQPTTHNEGNRSR